MKKVLLFLLTVLFGIFLLNSFHEQYPDEFDSILGGRYITEGKLPYRDWFQHHQPGAYVLASMLLPFSGGSFVRFRVLLGATFFLLNTGAFLLIRRKFKDKQRTHFYIAVLFAVALAGTFFWGQMLLADTLAAYLLLPAYTLLLLKTYYDEPFGRRDLLFVSIFTFLALFTSMTYIYVVAGLAIYTIFLFFKDNRTARRIPWKNIGFAIASFGLPYVLFFLYLFVTGSLKDYYFSTVIYNQYYIYNYPHIPGTPINPVRYAIVIASAFINNFYPAIAGVIGFPLGDPLQVTLALSNATLLGVLLLKKKYVFIFPFLMTLIFSNARSNPQQVKETDYQAAVYLVTSMMAGLFSLSALREIVDKERTAISTRLISGALLLLLGTYWSFSFFFLALKMEQRFFPKYMGDAPYIYDDPQIAPYINKMITPDDYVWIGPFDFKELFYIKTKKLPSKYHWFLQHAASTKIKDELIADLTLHRPKVIVFQREYAPWGGDASGFNFFFVDFLKKNYFRIFELSSSNKKITYRWKIGNTRDFDIDGDFNFDVSRQEEILKELQDVGLIEQVGK